MAIKILDTKTINRIAAGEVVERPASVVKELVENSIDARASEIDICIESGGRNLIAITDNGSGIAKDDIELVFMRHATSKLSSSDLVEIKYLGFRGEAMPSIAAVSRISLSSRLDGADEAWSITYEGGEKTTNTTPCSLPRGTYIEVRDLFFATPNRLKFLKTERAENQHIIDIVKNLAMINYQTKFALTIGQKKIFKYAKQTSLLSRLCEIEKEFESNAMIVNAEAANIKLTGYICKPTVNRGRSTLIYIFVNNRPIKDNMIIGAIRYAYHDLIPHDKYPVAVLHLEIPYDQVDVNVHPNKSEVRFRDKKLIYDIVVKGLLNSLAARIENKTSFSNENDFNLFSNNNFFANQQKKYNLAENYKPFINDYSATRDFSAPDNEVKDSFEYNNLASNQRANAVLQEQTTLVQDYPLGFARCQIYNTYIISQTKNGIIIVDQHAAHERLVYEYMKEVMRQSGIKRQALLLPEIVQISNQAGIELLLEYKDKLLEMGLYIEVTSDSTIIVKETPAIFGVLNVKTMITDLIDRLLEMEDILPLEDKMRRICSTISCHGSIRAGRELKIEEMNAMLRQMENTPFSGQCNHGRPTYIEMKLTDIEKLFERR